MAKFPGYPPPSQFLPLGITCAGLALVLAVFGLFRLADTFHTSAEHKLAALAGVIAKHVEEVLRSQSHQVRMRATAFQGHERHTRIDPVEHRLPQGGFNASRGFSWLGVLDPTGRLLEETALIHLDAQGLGIVKTLLRQKSVTDFITTIPQPQGGDYSVLAMGSPIVTSARTRAGMVIGILDPRVLEHTIARSITEFERFSEVPSHAVWNLYASDHSPLLPTQNLPRNVWDQLSSLSKSWSTAQQPNPAYAATTGSSDQRPMSLGIATAMPLPDSPNGHVRVLVGFDQEHYMAAMSPGLWSVGVLVVLIIVPLSYFMVRVMTQEPQTASAKYLLDHALDSVSNGVVITDAHHPKHPILSVNPAFSRVTKYEPKALLGRRVPMLEGPETDRRALHQLDQALHDGGACRIMTRFYRKTGERFCGELTVTPIRDTRGQTAFHVWELVDLSARERTVQTRAPKETWLPRILDSVPDGVIVINAEGRIEVVNAGIGRIFGFTVDELSGQSVNVLIPPPDRHRHDGYLSRYLRTGESKIMASPREVVGRRKDGELVTVELTVRLVRIGEETKFVGTVREKTARDRGPLHHAVLLKVALALPQCSSPKEAAETLLTICGEGLQLDRGALWVPDPTAHTLQILAHWSSHVQSLEEPDVPPTNSTSTPQKDFPEHVWKTKEVAWAVSSAKAASTESVSSHITEKTPDEPDRIGIPLTCEEKVFGVLEFQGARATQHDLSLAEVFSAVASQTAHVLARLHIQDDHERMQTQLRKTHKTEALGTLAGGIAHDFNNTLTAILGFSELAFPAIPAANRARAHLQQVLKAGSRAKDLVQQLLTFSRQEEQGHVPIQLQVVLHETINMLRSTLPSTIHIGSSLSKQCGTIRGDPAQLQQVLVNLCINAEFAMRKSGGMLEITLEEKRLTPEDASVHPTLHAGLNLLLTVRDSGTGMSDTVRRRMFEPFFSTKPAGEGTGMGLAVVQGIVTSHGGALRVESQPDHGTTVEVYFPLHHLQEANQVFPTGPVVGGEERILFVDDDGTIGALGGEMLESLGYTVVIRNSGKEAFKAFRTAPQQFHAVITDQIMPHMTGENLAAEIHTLSPMTPILLLTGAASNVLLKQGRTTGIAGYLTKPITKRDLALCLREILDTYVTKEHDAMPSPDESTAQRIEPCAPSRN